MSNVGLRPKKIDATYTDEIATIPAGVTLAGTMTGDGTTITGTGTDFSQIEDGTYLYYNGEVRRITANFSPKIEQLYIETAFTSNPSGADVVTVENQKYKTVSLYNQGGANATVDGKAFKTGTTRDYDSNIGIQPICINATGTEISALIQY